MTQNQVQMLIALSNLVVCCAIAWTCICRLNVMQACTTRRAFRLKYVLLIGGAAVSGFSPWFFHGWPQYAWPGPGQLVLELCFLLMLLSESRAWRDGLPEYARCDLDIDLSHLSRSTDHP